MCQNCRDEYAEQQANRNKFPGFPDHNHFMTSPAPKAVIDQFGEFSPELRQELYELAVAFYQEGWQDAALEIESAASELVYVKFPEGETNG